MYHANKEDTPEVRHLRTKGATKIQRAWENFTEKRRALAYVKQVTDSEGDNDLDLRELVFQASQLSSKKSRLMIGLAVVRKSSESVRHFQLLGYDWMPCDWFNVAIEVVRQDRMALGYMTGVLDVLTWHWERPFPFKINAWSKEMRLAVVRVAVNQPIGDWDSGSALLHVTGETIKGWTQQEFFDVLNNALDYSLDAVVILEELSKEYYRSRALGFASTNRVGMMWDIWFSVPQQVAIATKVASESGLFLRDITQDMIVNWTPEQCYKVAMAAVKQDGHALEYDVLPNMMAGLTSKDKLSVPYLDMAMMKGSSGKQRYDMALTAVQTNGYVLMRITQGMIVGWTPEQCYNVAMAAVRQDGRAVEYVTKDLKGVMKNMIRNWLPEWSRGVAVAAVTQDGFSLGVLPLEMMDALRLDEQLDIVNTALVNCKCPADHAALARWLMGDGCEFECCRLAQAMQSTSKGKYNQATLSSVTLQQPAQIVFVMEKDADGRSATESAADPSCKP